MTTHPHRRNQLIRIATKGICRDEFELQFVSERKRLLILRMLASWEDEPEAATLIELNCPTFIDKC